MSYHANSRVVIGEVGDNAVEAIAKRAAKFGGMVQIHEDKGDGCAACAVGTQMGFSKPFRHGEGWVQVGPGQVTCELCGHVRGEPVRTHATQPKVAPYDARIDLSLDERIARRRAAVDKSAEKQ